MADKGKLHTVMFPWLAFGHIIPYLELAKLIAQKGHKVTFIITPRNFKRLPKLPPTQFPTLHFVELPLPKTEGLPENAEASTDLPLDKVEYLKMAFDGLKEPVTRFLETSNPNWILFDFAHYWLPPIASSLNISTAFLSIFSAASDCFFQNLDIEDDRTEPEHFTVPPKWIPFPSSLRFKLFEIKKNLVLFSENVTGVSDATRLMTILSMCDIIVVRSSVEFEPEWLNLLHQLHRKPVIPAGFMQKKIDEDEEEDEEEDDPWKEMKGWLDKQAKGSVVYTAFGSESTPTQEELTTLAEGLKLSGLPFFWVLRNANLPQGFEEGTKDRGKIWRTWAPQTRILAHESVGGFLTHCGWTSVFEAFQFERPLILFPLLIDQGLNARILEDKKLGYPIPRDESDGSFSSESVAKSVKLVMVEEEGKIYREKVKEMRRVFADPQKQDQYVNDLLSYFEEHKKCAPGSR